MTPAPGWAVAQKGEILIRTVSPTKSGAAVNWIYLSGGAVMPSATEEQIIEFFDENGPLNEAVLVPVIVNIKLDG